MGCRRDGGMGRRRIDDLLVCSYLKRTFSLFMSMTFFLFFLLVCESGDGGIDDVREIIIRSSQIEEECRVNRGQNCHGHT